ncbi:MAG: gamma-glutamyltransferase family protein [Clostridiales bacterium]|jgi:gamma-glutamyltranspeptidase/glutathione hydrolase|nr:gamma-glutamyltransferase family protein [Clostridiales bacterium]
MKAIRPAIYGRRGVLATGHCLATSAGLKMFAKGGNAVDAGVAAGFALAVLKPHQNGLGGECPILIYNPKDGRVIAISGQGTAPRNATIEWFRNRGISMIPGDGFLGATVPGLVGSYLTALLKFGKLSLCDVLEPALELAEYGFPVYQALHNTLTSLRDKFVNEWPTSAEVYTPGGRIPKVGEILKQPGIARTFRLMIEAEKSCNGDREMGIRSAMDCFYRGEIADKILEFCQNNSFKDASGKSHTALLTKEDFDTYETRLEKPVYADYKNYRVFKCGPWTQGPVFLQQLKLLEDFDLKGMGHNSADYIHTVVECSKLAFADRDRYYGDPELTEVPLDMLLSEEYNAQQRVRIDPLKANNFIPHSDYVTNSDESYKGDTTHLDAVDAEGFMMSATPSGGWIPSSPVIPYVGFPLGTRAQMFNFNPTHPNCLAPGKRPRTTLTPSLAFKDGKPWMVFGTPGGDMQDQWTLQFFLNIAEFGMGIQEAVEAPTFHTTHFVNSFYPHTVGDGTVYVEEGIELAALYKLQEKGHRLHLNGFNTNGEVCGVRYDFDNGLIEGAASPKSEGNAYAMGW